MQEPYESTDDSAITDDSAQPPAERDSGEFIVYRAPDGRTEVHLRPVDGTVWMTQAQIADLYGTTVQNINNMILRILEDGELSESTINSELIVRLEGTRHVKRQVKHYSLDMVLAVGYRATTPRAVHFRQWATTVLREYLIKGFVMDDERLKDPEGVDYFSELLERIRDIRASEKRFYQKIRDLIAAASVDYEPTSPLVHRAFASIQNKLLFAVTGRTAADLIIARCDPSQPNMALTSWKSTAVRKADIVVAKNYLTKNEVEELNRLTVMLLDHAEDRARHRRPTTMAEWESVTDRFLEFNERELLTHNGRHSRSQMEQITARRYAEFDEQRKREAALAADRSDIAELEAIQAELERKK